jgi:hypothetical protein
LCVISRQQAIFDKLEYLEHEYLAYFRDADIRISKTRIFLDIRNIDIRISKTRIS